MSITQTQRPSQAVRLRGLDHVTVLSADFDRTERFYCGLLGMRPGPRPAIRVPGRWFYVGDQPVLHVLPRRHKATDGSGIASGPDARPEQEKAIDHFALRAEDRPAFEQRLHAAGQAFDSRRLADTDIWQVFVTDPDGARVELSFRDGDVAASACGPWLDSNLTA